MIDVTGYADDSEIDNLKLYLTYLLIKETGLDIEYIYALIFGSGRKIVWN